MPRVVIVIVPLSKRGPPPGTMPPDDTATQWREELSRTAVTASAADAAVKTHERVWSANFFYEEWKPVEGGRVIYGFKGADAEQRLRDRIAELKNEDIWGAPLSRPFLDRVIETVRELQRSFSQQLAPDARLARRRASGPAPAHASTKSRATRRVALRGARDHVVVHAALGRASL